MSSLGDSGLRIRVDQTLRMAFIERCRQRDMSASQVIRAFMRWYISAPEGQAALPFAVPRLEELDERFR